MSKTWKAVELAICRIFGGERAGAVGKDGPDCCGTAPYAVQVKHGKQVPKTIQTWMEQASRDATQGSLPVLVMHPHGEAIEDSLVVMRLREFREFYL